MSRPPISAAVAWTLLWAALVGAAIMLRPLLPIDETRYVSVAWEMWLRGDYLVPYLNGEPYSHKPPLLFWLINATWALFGVNDVTPRLVSPAFGLAALFLTSRLGARLWPGTKIDKVAPLLLIASVFWALFTTLSMFDMLMAVWTLVGVHGLIHARHGRRWRGWVAFASAIGLGVLSKGPVILVYFLPAAVAAPWWASGKERPNWPAWYGCLAASVLAGAALALAWAVPAGISGGQAYRDAIFWGQSAGRMVDSFAHRQPFWWYVPILPALLLPWLLWSSVIRALWRRLRARHQEPDAGVRLMVVWVAATFLILSFFSGKAPHYLIPVLPGCALLVAASLARLPRAERFERQALPLAVLASLIVITVHLAADQRLRAAYDIKEFAQRLGELQREGAAIAHYGNYHAQFNFLGRLREPLAEVGDADVVAWLQRHPKAKVVSYREKPVEEPRPERIQRFRGRYMMLWDRSQVLANPRLAARESGD